MVTNLKKTSKEYFGADYKEYYDKYKKERIKEGVSAQDVSLLGDYLDAVIFNGLKKYLENKSAVAYEEGTDDIIREIASVFGVIVSNNEKIMEPSPLTFEDLDKLTAENYAYRAEALEMLLEHWDSLYTINI